MCGIVGFISTKRCKSVLAKEHFMKYALIIDTLRGEDSTGVYTVGPKGQVKMKHSTLPGDRWIHTPAYNKLDLGVMAVVGHNRAATRGSVSLANAHPFQFGDVTLVHNGTLTDGGRSLSTYNKDLEVDSMQIALALSKSAPEEATDVLSDINGTFALVWYDKRDNSINFARNNGRPMHFAISENSDVMWFMSDGKHLDVVNSSLGRSQYKSNSVTKMRSNKHIKFVLSQNIKPYIADFKDYTAPVVHRAPVSRLPAPTTNNNTDKPLSKAVDKWRNSLTNYRGDATREAIRVAVNGKKRSVPEPQQKVLDRQFELRITDHLKFTPKQILDTTDKLVTTVTGEFTHPGWGGLVWPAIIHNVPRVQSHAYRDYDWLVHPVGLGASVHDDKEDVPVLLCQLIHCRWDVWAEDTKSKAPAMTYSDGKTDDEPAVDLMVPGPDGSMMRRSRLRQLCESGCVQCGDSITEDESETCFLVNDGSDLMCGSCESDLTNSAWESHVIQSARSIH